MEVRVGPCCVCPPKGLEINSRSLSLSLYMYAFRFTHVVVPMLSSIHMPWDTCAWSLHTLSMCCWRFSVVPMLFTHAYGVHKQQYLPLCLQRLHRTQITSLVWAGCITILSLQKRMHYFGGNETVLSSHFKRPWGCCALFVVSVQSLAAFNEP